MQVRNSFTVRCLFALLVFSWIVLSLTLPGLAEEAKKVAVDAAGNVYVAGDSWNGENYDFVTIKYSASGAWLWGRRYNSPANGDDMVGVMVVDAAGNVYVTGNSWNGANFDYVTIKYDTNGAWLWGRRYNGPANGNDYARALAVDAAGNVYVTGNSWNGSDRDYVTIKYDPDGNWLWGRRYNGPANGDDFAWALAMDGSGNVCVTGDSDNGANADYLTIKYNAAGAWIWGRRYNSPFNFADSPKDMTVDAGGQVYVTGGSYNGANYDYVTIKYDAGGAWIWGRRYSSGGYSWDYPSALAVDTNGNVHVTGDSSLADGFSDYVTIKYNAAGAWIWGRRYNGPANDWDVARALALDSGGNVLVTGTSHNGVNYDYVTIKYSPAGSWVWGQRFNSPANANDWAADLAMDASDNVCVTGESGNGDNMDYVTIKYSAAGAWVWGARYDGPD